tara:strand:- start:332 stop:1156 length:825 start_codon:yes stop_codon:yes gene_type:complete
MEAREFYSKQVEGWARKPLEESDLTRLSGEKVADIIKMSRPIAKKAYSDIFTEQSKEKNIFGKEGGWGFPILNKIRGAVHARRFEKAVRGGDIRVWGDKGGISPDMRAVGEYAAHKWTKSKKDADLFLAIGRPIDKILGTLIHEGGHMESMLGKQVSHRKEIKTKKELGGRKALHKLERERKAFFMGHKDGEEIYQREYGSSKAVFDKAILERSDDLIGKIGKDDLYEKNDHDHDHHGHESHNFYTGSQKQQELRNKLRSLKQSAGVHLENPDY